jgi:hypothetical protein
MSERIYAWLLRLYPARFRQAFGQEALRLFRDRARDERGVLAVLRLWSDLLCDLIVSLPREYRRSWPDLNTVVKASSGVPSFYFVAHDRPAPAALVAGALVSSVTTVIFAIFASQPADTSPPGPAGKAASASNSTAYLLRPDEASRGNGSESAAVVTGDSALDPATRHRVIQGVVENLNKFYLDPEVASRTSSELVAHEGSGDYDSATDGDTFAQLLTVQMRRSSHDMHLLLSYSSDKTPEGRSGPSPEVMERYRRDMQAENCTFETVSVLPGNVGYIKVNSFPSLNICESTAAAAMAKLNSVEAIIYDLRDNHGGDPRMVAFMAGYLFQQRTHLNDLYNRSADSTEESWTASPVSGNHLASKPVYILTSRSTFSGGEEFCYDLKMLGRATIVGETTRGGAHMASDHRIDDHFTLFVPDTRAVNPISKTNWEGEGVEPDISVRAERALSTARNLIIRSMPRKTSGR